MSRISRTFANLSEKSQKALIAYIMAGDPSLDATYPAVKALRSAGVDIIELGFPFSDPLADGPTIQAAAYRALQNPIGLDDYFRLIQRVRAEDDVPLILMTYYNVIYHYGLEAFAKTAGQAGLDGVIIPDLPLEESADLLEQTRKTGIDFIPLAAPTTSMSRIAQLTDAGSGFLYYVSRTGITGTHNSLPKELLEQLDLVVEASHLPVSVGFGVSNAEHARLISQHADGVVIGSALVERLAGAESLEEGCQVLGQFLKPVVSVLHDRKP